MSARLKLKRVRRSGRIEPYSWLGAGAVAVGVGVAALAGAGVATADDDGSTDTSSASTTQAGDASGADPVSETVATGSGREQDAGTDLDSSESLDGSSASQQGKRRHTFERIASAGDDDPAARQRLFGRNGRRPDTRADAPDRNTSTKPLARAIREPGGTAEDDLDARGDTATTPQPALTRSVSVTPKTISSRDEQEPPAATATPLSGPVPTTVDMTAKTANTLAALLGDPDGWVESPLAWLVLAAARRQLGGSRDNDSIAAVAADASNSAPTASLSRLGTPSTRTGKATGSITARDADGDKLTFAGMTTTKGTVTVTSRGSFTYTPTVAARHAAAANGATTTQTSDTFVITVSDGRGGLAQVPVTVRIQPANGSPSRLRSSVATPDPLTGTVTGTVSASDRDGDSFAYSAAAAPKYGSVTLNADGSFVYTPTEAARAKARSTGSQGTDSFKVTVDDGHGGTKSLSVKVRIAPANKAPVAGDPIFGAPNAATGAVKGSVNAYDPNRDTLTYVGGTTTTAKGQFVISSNGSFTYTPTAPARHAAATGDEHLATDTVSVTVRDKFGAVSSIPVAISIAPKNATPTGLKAVAGAADPRTGRVIGLASASDPDGDTLSFSGPQTTLKGSVLVASDGSFVYTPDRDARPVAGQTTPVADSFTITASDGHGGVTSLVVTVPVAPMPAVNHAPQPGNPPVTIISVNPTSGAVSGKFDVTDADADKLTYTVSGFSRPGSGYITIDATSGSFVFTPTNLARYRAWFAADQSENVVQMIISDGLADVAVDVTVPISPRHPDADGDLSAADLAALVAIGAVDVSENPDGSVRSLSGAFSSTKVRDASDAVTVLNRVAALLGAAPDFATGASVLATQVTDVSGRLIQTTYRLSQHLGDVTVAGGEVVLTVADDGTVLGVFSTQRALTGIDTTATIGRDQAVHLAVERYLDDLGDNVDSELRAALGTHISGDAHLMLVESGADLRLAWRVVLSLDSPTGPDAEISDPGDDIVIVLPINSGIAYDLAANGGDAGTVLGMLSGDQGAAISQSAYGYSFTAEWTADGIVLVDKSRGITTYKVTYSPWDFELNGVTPVFRPNIPGAEVAYDGQSGWNERAVGAHANLTEIYDFYRAVLGRTSFDGHGSPIKISIGFRDSALDKWDVDNAQWSGGIGQFAINGGSEIYERALDVLAHEYTHAVIQYVVGKGDWQKTLDQGESGALNEAYADILGSLIEASIENRSLDDPNRWLIGEDVTYSSGKRALRNLANPAEFSTDQGAYRSNYAQLYKATSFNDANDSGGEHVNSTIFSHAAYKMMMAEPTISADRWAEVFYNSLYNLPGGKSTFVDAREAVLTSARNFGFDSAQLNSIAKAFDEVGVTPLRDSFVAGVPEVVLQGIVLGGDSSAPAEFSADGGRIVVATYVYDAGDGAKPHVVLIDAATGKPLGNRITTAAGGLTAQLSPDGSRTLVTSIGDSPDTLLAVVDTATGVQIGNWIPVHGYVQEIEFSTAGDRAAITFSEWDAVAGTFSSNVAVVSMTTGAKIGPTVSFTTQQPVSADLSPNGTRVTVITSTLPSPDGQGSTHTVSVYNVADGVRVSDPITAVSTNMATYYTDNGNRLVLVTTSYTQTAPYRNTQILVMDTTSGKQVGQTLTIAGEGSSNLVESTWGGTSGYIVLATSDYLSRTYVTVVNTITGEQVGLTRQFDSSEYMQTTLTEDGARAVVTYRSSRDVNYASATTTVSVFDVFTGLLIGKSEFAGNGGYGTTVNTAGTRATVVVGSATSLATRVATINTATGTIVGQVMAITGQVQGLRTFFDAQGDRAVITTQTTDGTIRSAVFDTATGSQIGSTVVLTGRGYLYGTVVNEQGTRAVVTHRDDAAGIRITVINMDTGKIMGDRVALTGDPEGRTAHIVEESFRAILATNVRSYDPVTGESTDTTRIAVVDSYSGVQIGRTIAVPGALYVDSNSGRDSLVQVTPDGTRGVVATVLTSPHSSYTTTTTLLTVIDLTTGDPVGETFAVAGELKKSPEINAQGTRAVITTRGFDPTTSTSYTQVVVFNPVTGQAVGATSAPLVM